MKAYLHNHRQSVRKVKLLADLVRGKDVATIKDTLRFTDKKAAPVFQKLIDSAVANARAQGHDEQSLYVQTITVNKGVEFQRYTPRARGRAAGITRGASHIAVTLGTRSTAKKATAPKAKKAVAKKVASKPKKKVAA
jgi:large subunit ribosomal protein L22